MEKDDFSKLAHTLHVLDLSFSVKKFKVKKTSDGNESSSEDDLKALDRKGLNNPEELYSKKLKTMIKGNGAGFKKPKSAT